MMLNSSTRNWNDWLRANWKSLLNIMSSCTNSGPRSALRGRLPNVPGCGVVNAAGLSQRTSSFRYGSTPGTMSGRCVPRLLPPGMFVTVAPFTVALSARLMTTLMGTPLRALKMPPTRQPPFQRPSPGIKYTIEPLNVCGMSCGLVPYSVS